jgi:hypothetical protein
VIGGAVDEFLVLGADPPCVARLLPAREEGDQLSAIFDDRIVLAGFFARAHRARSSDWPGV